MLDYFTSEVWGIQLFYLKKFQVTERGNLIRETEYKSQMVTCGVVWVIALLIASPMLIYSDLHPEFTACVPTWNPNFGTGYQIFLFLTTYCIPGMLIAIIYSLIIYKTKSILSVMSRNVDQIIKKNLKSREFSLKSQKQKKTGKKLVTHLTNKPLILILWQF